MSSSQSLSGYGVVKIFFQKNADIGAALAQVTAVSQTVLKLLPAGITPPYVLSYNASSVPILNLALSSKNLPQDQLFDLGQNFIRPQLATVNGAALPSPYGGKILQAQVDLDQQAMQSHNVSADDLVNAISAENLVLPAGTQKIGVFEWNVALNSSPTVLDRINDLPVKKVDGTVIHVRDVAYAHDGSPPQTNIVRVNGAKAVLMSILNAGSSSTLDIIAGVKARLPRIEAGLPAGLDLHTVGDQSPFVRAAVTGVVREGAIAAALTGLMILLFLGSWRSTIIIMVEIPLAILFSLTALSLLGETINVMTLGGLALAVGILVDDGTVTLENINWHLEQGKVLELAIMDGARQIVVPAFVTLVCICIVFAPMFQLGGVVGYLFRPLAEAVVSPSSVFLLSRTLVPTLANYLLRVPHLAHGVADGSGGLAAPPRNPLKRFQLGFERRFTQNPRGLSQASQGSSRPTQIVYRRLPGLRRAVVRSGAVSRPKFLSIRRCRADPDPCPFAGWDADRGDSTPVRPGRAQNSTDDPARSARQYRRPTSDCPSAASTSPMATQARSVRRMRTFSFRSTRTTRRRLPMSSGCGPCCRRRFPARHSHSSRRI